MKNRRMSVNEKGFTLIELVVVIALIAIVSTLVISRLGGVKDSSRAKMNVANLARVGAAVDTFLMVTEHPSLDRMDALLQKDVAAGSASSNLTTIGAHVATSDGTNGIVLNAGLCTEAAFYGGGGAGLLCRYDLSTADVAALENLGFKYLMYGTDGGRMTAGDDGAWSQGSLTDPAQCMSVARTLTNGLPVAVVNPGAVSGGTPIGALAYQACGQDVRYTVRGKVLVDGVEQSDASAAFQTLNGRGGDGILLALGLGSACSMVGNNQGGVDSAPTCPTITAKDEYARYIVLFRLKSDSMGGRTATYAGVLDSMGKTIDQARAAMD